MVKVVVTSKLVTRWDIDYNDVGPKVRNAYGDSFEVRIAIREQDDEDSVRFFGRPLTKSGERKKSATANHVISGLYKMAMVGD